MGNANPKIKQRIIQLVNQKQNDLQEKPTTHFLIIWLTS